MYLNNNEVLNYYSELNIQTFVIISQLYTGVLTPESIDQPQIFAEKGKKIYLKCPVPNDKSEIKSCKFIFPLLNNDEFTATPDTAGNEKFQYAGSGFENGDCGLTILNVTKEKTGNITCKVQLEYIASELSEVIDVLYVERPTITFHKIVNFPEVGTEMTAYCDSRGSKPETQITWLLDYEILKNKTEKPDKENLLESEVTFKLKHEHFKKSLICRARHPAFEQGYEDKTQLLDFHFKPVEHARREFKDVQVESGHQTIGEIVIRANPKPILHWENSENSKELTSKVFFNYKIESPAGSHHFSLTAMGLTEQVLNKEYTIIAETDKSTNYKIYLGGAIYGSHVNGKFLLIIIGAFFLPYI